MARWAPNAEEPIGTSEPLGRRLFDEPSLAGAQDQVPPIGLLNLRHFQEKRDRNYSLDRMGKTGVDRSVRSHLLERATNAAKKLTPPKSFDGWAVVRASYLTKASPTVTCSVSPIIGDGLNENIYHAHAVRPENTQEIHFALQLRHLFHTHGSVEFATNRTLRKTTISIRTRWSKIEAAVKSWFGGMAGPRR